MKEYTASNGVKILADEDDRIRIVAKGIGYEAPGQHFTVPLGGGDALREFFRAEEDERLERWRWPKDVDYVVYPERDGLHVVLRESTGESIKRNGIVVHSDDGQAAADYREAHPEPKPWRDADCGESWYLEPFDIVYSCVGDRGHSGGLWFTRANVYGRVENVRLDDPRITAARRIYPEAP